MLDVVPPELEEKARLAVANCASELSIPTGLAPRLASQALT